MREVVIVDAIRTPLGRRGGVLSQNQPIETSALLLKELVKRNNLDPEIVDDVIYGCVSEVGAQSTNLARNVVLTAGWPYTIPGVTLDRQCSSSQQAVHFAANQIASQAHEVVVAGGTEWMSQIPLGSNVGQNMGFPFTQAMRDQYDLTSQGLSAERIAEKWGISREEADEFAAESQHKAARAQAEGRFKNELIPVPGKKKNKKDDGTEVARRDDRLRRGHPPEHDGRRPGGAEAELQRERRAPCRELKPDYRRLVGRAADAPGQGKGDGLAAARAHHLASGCRLGPGVHADRPDYGDAAGAAARRPHHARHRPRGD